MKRFSLTFLLFGLLLNAAAQQWEFDFGEVGRKASMQNGILDSKGKNFLVGFMSNDAENEVAYNYPYFMRLDADGNCENVYLESDSYRNQIASCCVQLENGNYFIVCEEKDTINSYSYPLPIHTQFEIIILNQDLDIVSERRYAIDAVANSFEVGQLLLDDDGSVVLCGSYIVFLPNWNFLWPVFYRFDEEGNVLACRYAQPDEQSDEYRLHCFDCHQLMKHPQSDGYLIFGTGASGATAMMFYDRQFNYVDDIEIEIEHGHPILNDFAYSDLWLSEDEMLLLGSISGAFSLRYYTLGLLRMKTDGTIIQCDTLVQKADTNTMAVNNHSMVCINDTTIFGAYYAFDDACYPVYSGLCLFDRDMELLGSRFFTEEENFNKTSMCLLPTSDGGCILLMRNISLYPDKPTGKIVKMRREDFNPIPCGVHKVPKQEMQASVFPNPAKDEVHFDITALPQDGENRICITDNLGRARMSRSIRGEGNVLTVGVSSLEPGVYAYVIYNSQNELLKGKFVKE